MRRVLALDAYGDEDLSRHRPRAYDAVMVGSEFCNRLLPSPAELFAVRRVCRGPLILATPVLPQADLEAVRKLLGLSAEKGAISEVVVNDLGLLELLRARFRGKAKISCGRILCHRLKIMPPAYANEFLSRYDISSFEIDDADAVKRLTPYGRLLSWHYPFRYATVTRFCPWERHWSGRCAYSCRGRVLPLRSLRVPKTLWLKGGGYFVRGQRPKRDAWRNVYTPQ